jgi:hypothetical protein
MYVLRPYSSTSSCRMGVCVRRRSERHKSFQLRISMQLIFLSVHRCTHTQTHTHTHTHIFLSVHTCTHTQTLSLSPSLSPSLKHTHAYIYIYIQTNIYRINRYIRILCTPVPCPSGWAPCAFSSPPPPLPPPQSLQSLQTSLGGATMI